MVAPFERNLPLGGSLRATAMAERLEARGATVKWRTVPAAPAGSGAKLRDLLRLRPALAGLRPAGSLSGEADGHIAAIAAHSYLTPLLRPLPAATMRIIDFHNLEWRHLADSARFESGLRRPWSTLQVRLMRRFELRALSSAALSVFASGAERDWAVAEAALPQAPLLAPSVLPQAAEEAALAVAGRCEEGGPPQLGYIGTLSFPPNAGALLRFLDRCWPEIRRAAPGVTLTIAGDCDDRLRRRLESIPGVEAHGHVSDLGPLLEASAAILMPVEGEAGTSLRALEYSLAGVWAIGTPAAYRGIPWEVGATADSPRDWARAVQAALEPSSARGERIRAARRAALRHQRDERPWDLLAYRIGT
jgi:hypothetical protein